MQKVAVHKNGVLCGEARVRTSTFHSFRHSHFCQSARRNIVDFTCTTPLVRVTSSRWSAWRCRVRSAGKNTVNRGRCSRDLRAGLAGRAVWLLPESALGLSRGERVLARCALGASWLGSVTIRFAMVWRTTNNRRFKLCCSKSRLQAVRASNPPAGKEPYARRTNRPALH